MDHKKKNKSTYVKEALLEFIDRHDVNNGDPLPSERELCDRFNVSRTTVRRALSDLESNGWIYRIKGKGAFVSIDKLPQQLTLLTSYSEDMRKREMKPGSIILANNPIIANSYYSNKLQIETNETIYLLRRLRLAEGEPMAIENCYMRYEIGSVIAETISNDDSLYRLFKEKCGITLKSALQTIEVGTLNNWERKLLGDNCPTTVLFNKRQTFDINDSVVEYVESKYRSDRYLFEIKLMA
jgi:GntR family transcriptional regulator